MNKRIPFKKALMWVLLGLIGGSMIKDKYSPRVLFDKDLKK